MKQKFEGLGDIVVRVVGQQFIQQPGLRSLCQETPHQCTASASHPASQLGKSQCMPGSAPPRAAAQHIPSHVHTMHGDARALRQLMDNDTTSCHIQDSSVSDEAILRIQPGGTHAS
eukprot:COSAG01_NODE_5769_length_4045_cov_3.262038_2_plen_116_part_00